jgi:endonuclease/exonuclease/phosphatase family metal-dependent hydrolase
VIGVVEIENQEVLNQFLKQGLAGQGYSDAYAGPSDDDRGIRNGVISKYPIVGTDSHRVWDNTWTENGKVKKTRDILEVTVRATRGNHSQEITYLVNHWPSRAGNPEFRNRIRLDTAHKMRKIIENLTRKNPSRLVVALGDFNDEMEDPTFTQGLKNLLNFEDLFKSPAGSIFATLSELPKNERGTYYYHKENRWNALDNIAIAAGNDVLRGNTSSYQYLSGSVRVVQSPFSSKDGLPQGCEAFGREVTRTSCPKGASDHLPVVADFVL